jgi:glyoxylase-like metal-dependent hydrolase (beta-lactamase superfamily II)
LTAHQAPPQPPPSVAFTPLRRDVGVFTGRGGTIGWLITPDAVVLVDSQFPDTAKLCLEGVKSRSKRQIDLLINTHHHGDHTSGNIIFKPETPHILAHENVPALQKKSAEERGNADQQAYADQTFGKTWDQDIGHERLQMRHYGPGHTGGDAVVTFAKANVVHMGDLVFRARHPFVDRPGGASVRNWLTTLEQVVKAHETDTIYIFGHAREGLGVSGTAADLTAMRDYFSAVLDHVQKGIAAGQSRDAIVALTALPKFDDYPNSPATALAGVLGVAYDELTQK